MNKQLRAELTEQVIAISQQIGVWMKQQTHINESNAEIKAENNLVSYVDKESERRFVDALSKLLPEAGFIAEEGTGMANNDGYNWVIDPLDGTTNFVHSVPIWCTSIALCHQSTPILGVIYDPNTHECFHAYQDGGAFLNHNPIRVSKIAHIEKSLLATGFPYDDFGREEPYLRLLQHFTHHTRGLRRLGSAALDMAWTACGRFEGFYEYSLNPWDVAAGTCILREAGGIVSEFNGGSNPIFGDDILASNGLIHDEMLEHIRNYFINHTKV